MDRRTIEKEGRNIAISDLTLVGLNERAIALKYFAEGANWSINSVWHNMNEKPNGMFVILADFGQEEYSFGLTLDGIESAKRWAYVSDLLPERKEETK